MYLKLAKYFLRKLKPSWRFHLIWVKCPHCPDGTYVVEMKIKGGVDYFKCKCGKTFKVDLSYKTDELP